MSICCTHGDITTYPVAQVDVEVGRESFTVEAALADKLPVSVVRCAKADLSACSTK